MRGFRAGRLGMVALWAVAACGRGHPAAQLLFVGRSPAATVAGFSWAPDQDGGRIVALDKGLRPVRALAGAGLARPVAVAALDGRLLVTEQTGDAVVLDTAGRLVREWSGPFAVSLYAAGRGGHVVAVRSPYRIPTVRAEPAGAPLIQVLDTMGRPLAGLAAIRVPEAPMLAQFANAGAVAVDDDGSVYFAPLVRDEIRKYDGAGRLLWSATRGLRAVETDPRFVPGSGAGLAVAHAIVNIALALGPDGKLYALGASDSAGTERRLDTLDPATGQLLVTRALRAHETAIAVLPDGTVMTQSAAALLSAPTGRDREPFEPAFALPDVAGDTVRLADYAGRVTLVNFWASWCHPCREEFPHMVELYRRLDPRNFGIAAISDDVERSHMLEFVREFDPPFPILVGGGRMKGVYHYRGLPYSVLLDRRGRVIERIFGFGGPGDFARLRETIAKELASP